MPYTSNVYSGLVNSFNDAVAGTIIDPADWNDLFADIEAAFNDVSAGTIVGKTTIDSATTCDIGAAPSMYVEITGTTTITSLGTSANTLRFLYFSGALTLTHNGTSLILPNATNIATVAGDAALVISDASGYWRCLLFSRSSTDPELTALAGLTSASNRVPRFTGSGTADLLTFDTDGTLAGNSDTSLASQKAVKTYVDQIVASQDAMVFKGTIDCSTNPNYPAADRGHTYRVSAAGKIGGGSGTNVEVGDLLLCLTDGTLAGTQAGVGTAWSITQTNLDGAVIGPSSATDSHFAQFDGTTGKLIKGGLALDTDGTLSANSATRVPSQSAVKTYAQPLDGELTAIAGLTSAADRLPYFTGSGTAALTTFTTAGRALVDDADAAAQRTTLGLVIGTDVQAYDAELAALAGLTSAADRVPYFTGSGTAALATFTSAGRNMVSAASATAQTALLDASTTSASGIIELATLAEVNTGTDAVRAVSPSTLAGRTVGAARLDKASVDQSLTGSTFTKVTFSNASFDTLSWFDNANDRLTVAVAGKYQVNGQVCFTSGLAANDLLQCLIRVNGTTITQGQLVSPGTADAVASVSDIISLAATNYVELHCYKGGSNSVVYGDARFTFLSMYYIGP